MPKPKFVVERAKNVQRLQGRLRRYSFEFAGETHYRYREVRRNELLVSFKLNIGLRNYADYGFYYPETDDKYLEFKPPLVYAERIMVLVGMLTLGNILFPIHWGFSAIGVCVLGYWIKQSYESSERQIIKNKALMQQAADEFRRQEIKASEYGR